jgi:hypothetical protein
MIHHLLLARLKTDLPANAVEELMVESRIRLLKIPEVMNLRCGKKLEEDNPFDFFISMDVENGGKLKVVEQSAIYLQYRHQIFDPKVEEMKKMNFEMEPGKDVRYS